MQLRDPRNAALYLLLPGASGNSSLQVGLRQDGGIKWAHTRFTTTICVCVNICFHEDQQEGPLPLRSVATNTAHLTPLFPLLSLCAHARIRNSTFSNRTECDSGSLFCRNFDRGWRYAGPLSITLDSAWIGLEILPSCQIFASTGHLRRIGGWARLWPITWRATHPGRVIRGPMAKCGLLTSGVVTLEWSAWTIVHSCFAFHGTSEEVWEIVPWRRTDSKLEQHRPGAFVGSCSLAHC